MMTVGMVSALALVGGHAGLALAIWPGQRVEKPEPHPDKALEIRAGTLATVAERRASENYQLKDDLKAALAREEPRELELAEAQERISKLVDERKLLRQEVARLHKQVTILTARQGGGRGEDKGDGKQDESAGGVASSLRTVKP
jgi:hypothetical protein